MPFDTETASIAGRKSSRKGTPNKATEEIREKFKTLLDENIDKIQEDLDKLEPEERLRIIMTMAKFVLPTLKSTELKNGNEQEPIIISFVD